MAASSASAPRLQSVTSVRHNNLPAWASYLYLFLMLFTVFVIVPILSLLTIWGTSRQILGAGIHNVVICLFPLWKFARKTINTVAQYSSTMETGEDSIRDDSAYTDGRLMGRVIKTSPYRHLLLDNGKQGDSTESMPLTISQKVICFQPVGGYCAYATLNTALQSFPSPLALPFTRFPKPLDIDKLHDLMDSLSNGLFSVECVTMSDGTKLEDFRRHVMEANNDECRVLANFHRKPLFAPRRTTHWWQSLITALGGHWSPLGGVVSKEMPDGSTEEYVLVLDVNRKFGPYMVKLERLFEAVKTKYSPLSRKEGYRGLVKLHQNQSNASEAKRKNDKKAN